MNIHAYQDIFEHRLRDEKDENSGFYSFTLEALKDGTKANKLYQNIREVIRETDLDEDSAYQFTVEALDAIESLVAGFEDDTRPPEGTKLEDYLIEPEIVEQYSEPPVYTSELLEWFSKKQNYAFVEDAIDEYGGKNQEDKTDLIQAIGVGYMRAWEEHYQKVLEIVKED